MTRRRSASAGFTLIETSIAVSLLVVILAALPPVIMAAQRSARLAQQSEVAQRAARERLEQLRSLDWTSEPGAVPVSDWSTDLSVSPPRPTGGPGLSVAPGDTLLANHEGYCDFLDAEGRWLAGGTRPPASASWVRRWSIGLLDELEDTLVLQVLVIPVQMADPASSVAAARGINGAWLLDIRTRSAR